MNKTDKLIAEFFTNFPNFKYSKGKMIINAKENPGGIYFLKRGYVKMYSIFEDGSELTVNIFKPGSFFPMIWGFTGSKNTYYFQAMTAVEVYMAPKSTVFKFLQKDPELFLTTTRRIMVGLEALLTNIQFLLFGNSYNRVATAVLVCAKRFGELKEDGSTQVKLRMTHKDISTLAGITRETTSLAILKLKKEGYIYYKKGNIFVRDMDKLSKIAFEEE